MNFQQPDGTWRHIGLTSFNSGYGCESGNPNAFTRTRFYLDWINCVIKSDDPEICPTNNYQPGTTITDAPPTTITNPTIQISPSTTSLSVTQSSTPTQTEIMTPTTHSTNTVSVSATQSSSSTSTESSRPIDAVCGVANPGPTTASSLIQSFIIGGTVAAQHEFPWQAFLFIYSPPANDGSRNGSRCSGSLISDQFILTAAHCLDG